jgi:hypothetical protein
MKPMVAFLAVTVFACNHGRAAQARDWRRGRRDAPGPARGLCE